MLRGMRRWGREDVKDVVILGAGAAGLTAAILAHDKGASVLVIERTDKVGGTTAVSGGGVWIPMNHHMHEVGAEDSREEALAYCKAIAMGKVAADLIETFVDTAPRMLRYLEERTPLRFSAMTATDYHVELPGGKLSGRSVEPQPFDTNSLGEWRARLRPPSSSAFPITRQEAFGEFDAFYRPWTIPQDLVAERMGKGIVALGQALAAGLLKAVLDREIPILLDTRAQALIMEDGRVVGVRAGRNGESVDIRVKGAVVLATAGFEWSEPLKAKFLGGPITGANTPPFNEGDGLIMAMEVGADLANMGELWHFPSLMIPGEMYEDRALARGIVAERSGPHVIWVNARGRRFVNEAANYNSVGKVLFEIDTNRHSYRNLPAWAILDSQYRRQYVLGTTMPEDPDPDWLHRGDTLQEVAGLAGIDPQGLEETVARWNSFVREGKDRDYGKGDNAYDRFQGDKVAPNANLGTIEKPPFYALSIHPGALGTKGGPRTNSRAQVMNVRGIPIPGLYAAGNVAASIAGPGYYGRGATLGPAMTWGYIAGVCAADDAKRGGR